MVGRATNMTIANALIGQFKAGVQPTKVAEGLAAYLIEEKRISDKNAILRDVEKRLFADQGLLYVRSTSAQQLSQQLKDKIADIFSNSTDAKKVVVSEEIDGDVIGGVRCQTTESVLDLTIRRQIYQLKRSN